MAELIHRRRTWRAVAEAELATVDRVFLWANRRLDSGTGHVPPAEYERASLRRQAQATAAA